MTIYILIMSFPLIPESKKYPYDAFTHVKVRKSKFRINMYTIISKSLTFICYSHVWDNMQTKTCKVHAFIQLL